MSSKSTPRHVLRQMLRAVLPTDSDFGAFCVDFFPEAAERFANSMDRVAKASLLIELAEAENLLAALKQYDPQRLAQYERRQATAGTKPRNPYRGLSAFQVDEADLFFGREALTGQLWQRFEALHEKIDATRLLAIVGPSGSGKSSVARAGLLAALVRSPVPGPQPIRLAIVKPGERPIESLARTLVPLLPSDSAVLPGSRQVAIEELLLDKKIPAQGLRRFVADLPEITDSPLVMLVDQFEELYMLCKDPAERDVFVESLLHAASDSRRQVSIVLTLRSDFLGETQRHHNQLNRLIAAQGMLVPALSSDELRDAIVKPADQAGQPIDPATVELLLTEARGSQGALPLLEFALTRIWEGMQRGEEPSATLREIGSVGGALAGEAQKIYQGLSASERATAQRALVRLVQLGEGTPDTRRRAPIRELCGQGQTEADVLAVLRRFSTENARFVTLSEAGAEVTHEALLDHWTALRKWIDDNREDRRLHDRAAESARLWDEDKRRPGRLWRRPDLDLLHHYQKRKPEELSPLQGAFLRRSEQQQQREKLLRGVSVVAVFMALVVAAGIYVTGERQRRRESDQARERIRQQLLDAYVEQGRQLLLEKGNLSEAVLWLHRARARGSTNVVLPELLRDALFEMEATQVVLAGPTSSVLSATYSPDGKRIVTVSNDNTAHVWEAETGRLLTELKGHEDGVLSAMYSPDGKRIVTVSNDNTARVWETETGRLLAELKGHEDTFRSAAYSPDGKRIVTASKDKTARVWEAETGRLLTEIKGHGGSVNTATYSPDGKRIVTASNDKTARVWEAETGRLLTELKGHGDTIKTARVWEAEDGWLFAGIEGFRDGVNTATYSPDGKRIVTASNDKTARVWEAETGRLLAKFKGHRESVRTAAYSPDGKHIVTVSYEETACVWEAETGHLLNTLKGHEGNVSTATYSPDGKRIVTTSKDKTARVWEAETGRLLAELKGHEDIVRSAAYSPDGKRIVTTSDDKTARVWKTETGRLLAELQGHEEIIDTATYSPDGKRIVTAGWENAARVWETETGRLLAELKGHGDSINTATYSPDGKRIVTASYDNTARVWETETGRLLAELKGHEDTVRSAAYSPDGKRIVTASKDKTARVWETETGRLLAELKGHEDIVRSAAYSPDGKRIVTTSDDKTARVWETETGRLLAELKGHGTGVSTATYSPDGKHIVTASNDKTARVWEAETGRLLTELKGHGGKVSTATYSPDGKRIVTASYDDTARVWEAETGHLLTELKGHGSNVLTATYSPDGKRIVTASDDKTARVWETETGRLLAEFKGHGGSVTTASYSPDGQRIVTASKDKTARVWVVAPESRTADEIEKAARCKLVVRFASDDSNVIIPALPNPAECLPNPLPPLDRLSSPLIKRLPPIPPSAGKSTLLNASTSFPSK